MLDILSLTKLKFYNKIKWQLLPQNLWVPVKDILNIPKKSKKETFSRHLLNSYKVVSATVAQDWVRHGDHLSSGTQGN